MHRTVFHLIFINKRPQDFWTKFGTFFAIVMTRQATNVHFERKALKCALFTKDSSPSFCLTVSLICHSDFYSLSRAVNCEEFPWIVNWLKWQCLFSLSNSTSVTFDYTYSLTTRYLYNCILLAARYLTLICMRGDTFISLSFFDQIMSTVNLIPCQPHVIL